MDQSRLLELARQRLERGQTDGAIDALRELLSEDPEHASAHAVLALALLGRRRLHAARHEAGLALALEPTLELAHAASARIALAGRNYAGARKHLLILLEMAPQEAEYYRLMAALLELERRMPDSLALLEKAQELDPEDVDTLTDLGAHHLAKGDRSRAETYALAALQISPDNADALVLMGDILLRQAKVEAAREHAVWVLRQQADHVSALRLLAMVKARQSPLIGLWWRYNSAIMAHGETRAIIVLLVAFVLYHIAQIAAESAGQVIAAQVIHATWLGLALYSFAGPVLFARALKKELAAVKLSRDF